MLAFTINVLYLISLLFVPNPPAEASNRHCLEIAAIVQEAVENGEMSPIDAAEMIERCNLVEDW